MEAKEKRNEPVFKAAVEVTNQKECNALKVLCIKYDLPIWRSKEAFDILDYDYAHLFYGNYADDDWGFYVDVKDSDEIEEFDVVSFEEFEQLANNLNPQYDGIDDILSKIKELNRMLN
jgi:hypothetical protein